MPEVFATIPQIVVTLVLNSSHDFLKNHGFPPFPRHSNAAVSSYTSSNSSASENGHYDIEENPAQAGTSVSVSSTSTTGNLDLSKISGLSS